LSQVNFPKVAFAEIRWNPLDPQNAAAADEFHPCPGLMGTQDAEVGIKVTATAINPADWKMREYGEIY